MRTHHLALLIAPVLLSGCIHTGGSSPLDLIPLSERALMFSGGAEPQNDGQKISVTEMLARARQGDGTSTQQPRAARVASGATASSAVGKPSLTRPIGLWSQPTTKSETKAVVAPAAPSLAPAPKQALPKPELAARDQRIKAVKTAVVPPHTQREREALRQAMFWTNAARNDLEEAEVSTRGVPSGFQNAVMRVPDGPDPRLPDIPQAPSPRPEAPAARPPSETPSESAPEVIASIGRSIDIDAPGNGLSGQLVIAAGQVLQQANDLGAKAAVVETPDREPMPLGEMRDAVAVSKLLKTGGLEARIAPCADVLAGKLRVRLGEAGVADVGACQEGSGQ